MAGQYDDLSKKGGEPGPLDAFFRDQFAICILIAVCCRGIGLIIGLIEIFTGKDPQAKKNGQIVAIIDGALLIVGCIVWAIVLATGGLAAMTGQK